MILGGPEHLFSFLDGDVRVWLFMVVLFSKIYEPAVGNI